jgi:hypothetical protein
VQNTLGIYIARNQQSSVLTKSDAEFLLPSGNAPSHHSFFLLCKELENPYLFVLLLRQAISLFLKPFTGTEVASCLRDFYRQFYSQDVNDDFTR